MHIYTAQEVEVLNISRRRHLGVVARKKPLVGFVDLPQEGGGRYFEVDFSVARSAKDERHLGRMLLDYRRQMVASQLRELSISVRGMLQHHRGDAHGNPNLGSSVRVRTAELSNVLPEIFDALWWSLRIKSVGRVIPGLIIKSTFKAVNREVEQKRDFRVVFETLETLTMYLGSNATVRLFNPDYEEQDANYDDMHNEATKRPPPKKKAKKVRKQPLLVCNFPVYRNKITFKKAASYEHLKILTDRSEWQTGDRVHCLRGVNDGGYNVYDYGFIIKTYFDDDNEEEKNNSDGSIVLNVREARKKKVDVEFRTAEVSYSDSGTGEQPDSEAEAAELEKFTDDCEVTTTTRSWYSRSSTTRVVYPTVCDAQEVVKTVGLWEKTERAAQSIDSPYGALILPHTNINVYPLKLEEIDDSYYYLAIVGNATGEKHCILTLPAGTAARDQYEDLPIYLKGNVGYIPARYVGLLEPFKLPALHYNSRRPRSAPLTFSSRLLVTNAMMEIQGLGCLHLLTPEERAEMKAMYPNTVGL